MRLTSQVWVGALIRRAMGQGAFAAILNKGASEAGAIFVVVRKSETAMALYGPAPQSASSQELHNDRAFELLLEEVSGTEIQEKLDRELRFDPDLWIVEIEDRDGRSFLENVIIPD